MIPSNMIKKHFVAEVLSNAKKEEKIQVLISIKGGLDHGATYSPTKCLLHKDGTIPGSRKKHIPKKGILPNKTGKDVDTIRYAVL